MADAMVTGRMPLRKKESGNAVLAQAGLNPSQAIGFMYDRLIESRSADFLLGDANADRDSRMVSARAFIDRLVEKRESRFDEMTDAQIKRERLASRGLM